MSFITLKAPRGCVFALCSKFIQTIPIDAGPERGKKTSQMNVTILYPKPALPWTRLLIHIPCLFSRSTGQGQDSSSRGVAAEAGKGATQQREHNIQVNSITTYYDQLIHCLFYINISEIYQAS